MDKFRIFHKNKNEKENHWNERIFIKDSNTPNKIEIHKIKKNIKHISRDVKKLNLFIDEINSTSKMNITSNIKTVNKTVNNIHKPQKLTPSKTSANILELKINKMAKKYHINNNNRNILKSIKTNNNDTYKNIINLWEKLDVTYIYRNIFHKIISNLTDDKKGKYYSYEYKKLTKLYDKVNNINSDYEKRSQIIAELKAKEEKNYDKNEIQKILSQLNEIRNYTLNIINNIMKLRKDIGYDVMINKYDLNKGIISNINDYILAMNNDINFLVDSPLNQYFNFAQSDPFFTSISQQLPEIKDDNDNKLYIINNYDNILLDELFNEEINLKCISSKKNSLDSVFSIVQKSKLVKASNIKLNNIIKNKKPNFTNINIIKANRGLSRQKLRPRTSKIYIEAGPQSKTEYKNVKKGELNQEDIKIFEKIIEEGLMEKNNIDSKTSNIININNKFKDNKSRTLKHNSIDKISNESKNIISDSEQNEEKLKNKISNFIQNLFDEYEQSKKIAENETKICKKYSNYSIEIYKNDLSSLITIYKEYYKKIPEKMKIGFNINEDITKYIEGIYPKVLIIKYNEDEIIGIITLSYILNNVKNYILKNDTSNYNKTLFISSISCTNEYQFSDILVNTIDFCQNFFYFEEIILKLYYLNKNGNFILYTNFEKIIKTDAKFRWVNMENDGLTRTIRYKYKNNNNMIIKDENDKNNILNLKSVYIIGFEEEKKYDDQDERELSFINDFCINYLLIELNGQNNNKIKDQKNSGKNYLNELIEQISFKKMNHSCSDYIISQVGKVNEIKNFFKENENTFNNSDIINKIDERIFYESYFSSSIMNINNSFKNIMKQKYNEYIYNVLFRDQINEFTIKEDNDNIMQFYLIKTGEQNTSIIIYELKNNESFDDIKKMFEDDKKEKNLSEIFNELFAKVTKKPNKIDKNIYIPCFKILNEQLIYRPTVFDGVILENNEELKNYKINCLNFIEELTFGINESKNIEQNLLQIDNIDNNENIIIKNDFIINIVDNDLIFELHIPTVSSFFIKKEDWIKSSSI